jgi:phenylpropionate dioxygenase-like ring-hydroxylating dioxygenase large terminal subunit
MNHPNHVRLVRKLIEELDRPVITGDRPIGQVAASEYTSAERFDRERAQIFARMPALVGHQSELSHAGACLTAEIAGIPIVVVRGSDGETRAFKNACRHRSTRLVAECDTPCTKKALVCPYHGWTYDLTGKLVHVPHVASFHKEELARGSLVPVHAAMHGGFVWAALEPFEPAAYLGSIAEEFAALGMNVARVYRRRAREVRGNWKLVIDAFLDAYHIRHLHRDTLHRFFLDARSELELAGDHVRAISARRPLLEARTAALETADLRDLVTPSYVIFPSSVFVLSPDYASVLTMAPLAPDRTRFVHTMLIADGPLDAEREEHYAKSFTLLDDGVFGAEDLMVVEAMQRGIASGANETLLFGELEHAAVEFHRAVARKAGIED